MQEKIH